MDNVKILQRQIKPAVEERYIKTRIHKEQCIFFALCSDHDREYVMGKRKMSLEDFERIHYFMLNLGFEELHTYFLLHHMDLFDELSKEIETNISKNAVNTQSKLKKVKNWDKEFLDQLPAGKIRNFIREIFTAFV